MNTWKTNIRITLKKKYINMLHERTLQYADIHLFLLPTLHEQTLFYSVHSTYFFSFHYYLPHVVSSNPLSSEKNHFRIYKLQDIRSTER
jgi:hypothetical protein